MENQRQRIELYRQRTFSEKLNATFDFIRENWKPLLKYSFYLIMPICLVQTFAMNSVMFGIIDSTGGRLVGSSADLAVNGGIFVICCMIGMSLLSGLIYAMMQTYSTHTDGLQNAVFGDFKEHLVRNALRYLGLNLLIIMFAALLASLTVSFATLISPVTLSITVPIILLFTFLMIPLVLIFPTYLFERYITVLGAIKKAWKLGISSFWGMLGFLIVLYFIASVIQSVTMVPWYILLVISSIFSNSSDPGITQSIFYKFGAYVFGLIQSYGNYVSMMIGVIGLAFQYFHAREKIEGVTIESNINNFSQL